MITEKNEEMMAQLFDIPKKRGDIREIMKELLYKNGCWGCLRSREASNHNQQYICPKLEEHWKEYNENE